MKKPFQYCSRKHICAGLIVFLSVVAAQSGSVAFNYDRAGRLTKAEFAATKSIQYNYSPAGNLLQRAVQSDGIHPDSDGDGMDDAWEVLYFGSKESRDGTLDFDSDGFSDLHEFLAGTLPNDGGSVLRVLPSPLINGGGATVEWQAVAGKTYRLQFKNSLNETGWTNVPGDITANGAVGSKSDPTASGQPLRYYRVLLVP